MNDVFTLHRGTTPLLVSLPHVGTQVPAGLQARWVDRASALEDTDWFLDRLYGFAADRGASLLVPRCSRWVVDLNRSPDDRPLYTGVNTTGLCPTRFFSGDALYRDGCEPDAAEVAERVRRWWQPYHDALADELQRLVAAHGHAVLFDGHSIKSELPWLFDGTLPHMNLGSAGGTSSAPSLVQRVKAVFDAQTGYSHVLDGRFKGGHITRRYGQPSRGVHALQLEMCWRAYMDEDPPYRWHEAKAAAVTPLLERLVDAMLGWRPDA